VADLQPISSQVPKAARGEDEGEKSGHAERDDRPDEERSAGIADPAAQAIPLPLMWIKGTSNPSIDPSRVMM
jgi:hypothetical protein